jgi:DNA processing protein
MNQQLSANTQAILLLTAPLIAGREGPRAKTLTLGEYKRVVKQLKAIERQPSDLIGTASEAVIADCGSIVPQERLRELLGRGFLLGQAVDQWRARAIWVISRADAIYPRRWKSRLQEDCPPVLYGCGDPSLLATGGLAVVGSRNVAEDMMACAAEVGRSAAVAGVTIVSGGARGIDSAAMRGCLDGGGHGCAVLADSLGKHVLDAANRAPLAEGRLVLVSPYDPAARFNVGHAMGRNKLIYALADRGLVVNSDLEKGGTWAGAIEQTDRYRWFPLFIRMAGEPPAGNAELVRRGGVAWTDSPSPEAVLGMISSDAPENRSLRDDSPGLFGPEESIDKQPTPVIHPTT